MKLITLFFIISIVTFISCITDEMDMCVNLYDCDPGQQCIDGVCVPGEGVQNDDDNTVHPSIDRDQSSSDDKQTPHNDDNELNDMDVPDDRESSDTEGEEIVVCKPDSCNGNGACSVVDGQIVCECDEGYKGDDCSECAEGYSLESGECVEIISCDPDPCNGAGECLEMGNTVTCNCDSKYTGQWCENCADGYLKSSVDGKCKPDCITGNINCLPNMECRVDPDTNEAGCDCKEGYFGTNCNSCDPSFFCSGRGSCNVQSNLAVCTCNTGYGGADCSTCASGYKDFNNDGTCYEDCHSSCGQSGGLFSTKSYGTCQFTGSKGECVCDQGWEDPIIILPPFAPECSICKKNDPPPEHSTDGCPASCKDNDGYYILCGSNGKCYFEITGSNKRYCKCDSGYTLDNGDPYSGTCV